MSDTANKNWEDLARAARVEQDSEKLIQIVEELNRALDEQSRPSQERVTNAAGSRTAHSLFQSTL